MTNKWIQRILLLSSLSAISSPAWASPVAASPSTTKSPLSFVVSASVALTEFEHDFTVIEQYDFYSDIFESSSTRLSIGAAALYQVSRQFRAGLFAGLIPNQRHKIPGESDSPVFEGHTLDYGARAEIGNQTGLYAAAMLGARTVYPTGGLLEVLEDEPSARKEPTSILFGTEFGVETEGHVRVFLSFAHAARMSYSVYIADDDADVYYDGQSTSFQFGIGYRF